MAVFNLQVEDGIFIEVPEFYSFTLTDVNGRTTFAIEGVLGIDRVCITILNIACQKCRTYNASLRLYRECSGVITVIKTTICCQIIN